MSIDFAIIHHDACTDGAFHYRVTVDGEIQTLLPDATQGIHKSAIAIAVAGDCDEAPPADRQVEAVQRLLVRLKTRYPNIELGGHRQVRGSDTTCPGRRFPLSALRDWAQNDWERARDDAIARSVQSQYGSRS